MGDSPSGKHPELQCSRPDSQPSLGGLYSRWLFGELQPSIQGAGAPHDRSHTRMTDGQAAHEKATHCTMVVSNTQIGPTRSRPLLKPRARLISHAAWLQC